MPVHAVAYHTVISLFDPCFIAFLLQAESASAKTAAPHPAIADLSIGDAQDASGEGGRDTAGTVLANTAPSSELILPAAVSQSYAYPFVFRGDNAIQYIGKEGTFRRVCPAHRHVNVPRCFMSHAFPNIPPGSRLLTLQVKVPKQAVAAAVAAGAVQQQQPSSTDNSSEVSDWPAMEVVGSVEQVKLACSTRSLELASFGGVLRPFAGWRILHMSKVRIPDFSAGP